MPFIINVENLNGLESAVFAPDLNTELVLNRGDGLIVIETAVLQILHKYRQCHHRQPEQGGVFIGEIRSPHIVITHVTEPGPHDLASRFGFVRKKRHHQTIVDELWQTSGGYLIYLGEWHTHPESIPTPSGTDLKMIQTQFKKNKINEPFLLLIIQGTKELYVGLYDGNEIHIK